MIKLERKEKPEYLSNEKVAELTERFKINKKILFGNILTSIVPCFYLVHLNVHFVKHNYKLVQHTWKLSILKIRIHTQSM